MKNNADASLNPDLRPDDTEELVAIARKFGFDKVAAKLLGEETDDEESEMEFEETGTRLPSQHSRRAVHDTLRSMGVEWND